MYLIGGARGSTGLASLGRSIVIKSTQTLSAVGGGTGLAVGSTSGTLSVSRGGTSSRLSESFTTGGSARRANLYIRSGGSGTRSHAPRTHRTSVGSTSVHTDFATSSNTGGISPVASPARGALRVLRGSTGNSSVGAILNRGTNSTNTVSSSGTWDLGKVTGTTSGSARGASLRIGIASSGASSSGFVGPTGTSVVGYTVTTGCAYVSSTSLVQIVTRRTSSDARVGTGGTGNKKSGESVGNGSTAFANSEGLGTVNEGTRNTGDGGYQFVAAIVDERARNKRVSTLERVGNGEDEVLSLGEEDGWLGTCRYGDLDLRISFGHNAGCSNSTKNDDKHQGTSSLTESEQHDAQQDGQDEVSCRRRRLPKLRSNRRRDYKRTFGRTV